MREARDCSDEGITIRLAKLTDLSHLSEVESESGKLFRDEGMPEIADGETLPLEDLEEGLGKSLLWVAEGSGGAIAGFALVIELDLGPHLEEISVLPAFGRRGIGRRLVEQLAAELSARGHRRLTLSTFSTIPWNGPFYRKLGFSDLPESEWSPEIVELRRHEAVTGLDPGQRVILVRDLAPKSD